METIKKENDRILRAQEELNQILWKDFRMRKKINEQSLKVSPTSPFTTTLIN